MHNQQFYPAGGQTSPLVGGFSTNRGPGQARRRRVKLLSPGKPGRRGAPGPQGGKLQMLHGGRGHLEDYLAGMPDDLGRHVQEPRPQRRGIGRYGHHIPTDILFEALEGQKGHQHTVVQGRMGAEAQKRQFFKAEILQAAVHQFVGASAVGLGNDPRRREIMLLTRRSEAHIDFLSHPQIGVIDGQGAGKIQRQLLAGYHRAAQKGPAERVPGAAAVAQFQIVPGLPGLLITPPLAAVGLLRQVFQVVKKLAAADLANPQFFKGLKELLVKKPGIYPDDDGHILPVVFADDSHDMLHRLDHGIPVVAVFAARPETPRR